MQDMEPNLNCNEWTVLKVFEWVQENFDEEIAKCFEDKYLCAATKLLYTGVITDIVYILFKTRN